MPDLKINIPHHLPPQEAVARIRNLFSKLKREHEDKISNVKESWSDVQPSTIDITAKGPVVVSLLKGKIKQVIENEAKELLK